MSKFRKSFYAHMYHKFIIYLCNATSPINPPSTVHHPSSTGEMGIIHRPPSVSNEKKSTRWTVHRAEKFLIVDNSHFAGGGWMVEGGLIGDVA